MEQSQTEKRPRSDQNSESPEEEEVDPRIQGELEKLNQSTEQINRWETELEDSRQRFRAVLVEATVKLDEQVKKIGKAVDESKPFWEARRVARQAQQEAQRATQDYQRAIEVLRAAKETIALAEERLLEEDSRQFDSAWQEMLNHATQRVMEAEHTRTRSESEHKETAANYNAAMSHMKTLEKKLKRTINKSRPYFELKAKYYLQLEQLKKTVDDRQAKLMVAKGNYKAALRNLETISDEIHARRRSSAMGQRGRGVGAEAKALSTELPPFHMDTDGISMASLTFEEDGCDGVVLEDTHSMTSLTSATPSTTDLSYRTSPSPSCPNSLVLPSSAHGCNFGSVSPVLNFGSFSPVLNFGSVSPVLNFGSVSPVLGPRSECSGASSPECDHNRGDRAEGAEAKVNTNMNASAQKSLRRITPKTEVESERSVTHKIILSP